MTPSDDAKNDRSRSPSGAETAAARKARQAEQLRANLAKRKAQQRKRDTVPSGKEGA